MALADLLAQIQANAEAQATAVETQAQADADQIAATAQAEAERITAEVAADTEKKSAQMLDKVQNLGRQESKAAALAARREALKGVAQDAAAQLKQMGDADRQNIFLTLLQDIKIESPTIHPVAGEEAAVKKALQTAKKEFTMGDVVEGIGGFVVIGESVEIDCRFDTLLTREILPKVETEVSQLLFGANT